MSKSNDKERWMRSSILAGIAAALIAVPAVAQDSGQSSDNSKQTQEEKAKAEKEAKAAKKDSSDVIEVTGSRLKRSTFTSISPVQVITSTSSQEAGLIDPADILQGSTASTGQQIDTTFQGFVLDNGPGSSSVDLRGLGPARTLVLINGRRVAPAGVEGAPSTPDLNLLPSNLIERYEVLLDGASSVYGSDAEAGVVNAIMRKDFDGFEVQGYVNESEYGGGSRTLSGSYGWNNDRAFIGIGAEYTESDEIKLADRPFTDVCDRNMEFTPNGEIRSTDLYYNYVYGQRKSDCKPSGLAGRVFFPNTYGSVYYIDGVSNSGIPNFNESNLYGVGVDSNGDGVADITFADYSLDGPDNAALASLFPKYDRYSVMSYGEYNFGGASNFTLYYEGLYSHRNTDAYSGQPQLFPEVTAQNPYNPCGVNGVDCGLAVNTLLTDPNYIQAFQAYYNGGRGSSNCFGVPAAFCTPATFGLLQGPSGPISATPIVGVKGDRNFVHSDVGQLRLIGGGRFDIPQIPGNWSGDVSLSYSKSSGSSRRTGVNEKKLNFALGQYQDATGAIVASAGGACVADPNNPNPLSAGEMAGCVPVNMFAPSLYSPLVGDFATQAERDYVFSDRTFDTTYEQTVLNAYFSGSLFDLPAGSVDAVFGGEIRWDSIDSQPNAVASEGQLFGFFVDEGATGSKYTRELFAELGVPLMANQPFFHQLDLELSGRYTDDEFYGDAGTYSAKLGWRPVPSLLLRGTIGSSFRAPNLRELYLKNQSGFNTVYDPCSVPQDALNPLTGAYDPAADNREASTLQNCILAGVDPLTFNSNSATGSYSVEINRAGALFDPQLGLTGLNPETSTAKSIGATFEQPWTSMFDLSLSTSYYEIEVNDSIRELTASFVVYDCYIANTNLASPRCASVVRGPGGFITNVKAGFQNQGKFITRGLDFNARFGKEFTIGSRIFDLNVDVQMNRTLEQTQYDFNTTTQTFDPTDYVGSPGTPKWKGLFRGYVNYNDFRFTWTTNFIQGTEQLAKFQDSFSDIFGTSDTCLGTSLGDYECRDVDFVPDYWLHSASLYYTADTWTAGAGVRNVFDTFPPQVDGSEILAVNNTPIGLGYNLNGRTFFVNVKKQF